MIRKLEKGEKRNFEEIKNAYEIEKELSNKLRNSSKEQRRNLYSSIYDEFFKRVPLAPQLIMKHSPEGSKKHVDQQIKLLKPYLKRNITFLEIGPGDCSLSFEITKYVNQVYAIDVSKEITDSKQAPSNFRLLISDGSSIPIMDNSVSLAYSNQLMEHLHPEDAIEQLKNIYISLMPGGIYICITPNRLNGPHDISKYFDKIATGFHLKEYTFSELKKIFKQIGFLKIKGYIKLKEKYLRIPTCLLVFYETVLEIIPTIIRRLIVQAILFRSFMDIRIVGEK